VRRFVLILCATPLASCGTTGLPATSDLKFCDGARPIYTSPRDTAGTLEQVHEHNAVGVVACGWKRNEPKTPSGAAGS
jgi:hypothetical protein